MFEVLVLSRHNLMEVSRKTGRSVSELELALWFAKDQKELVVFTVETTEWRIKSD